MSARSPLVLLVFFFSCGGGGRGSPGDGGILGSCRDDTTSDVYVPDLRKAGAGGIFNVRLLESVPAPPRKGANVWTIAVEDATGAPVAGAVINVTPVMPAHGHSSTARTKVTPGTAVGIYRLEPIYLFMAGVWRITIDVAGGNPLPADRVEFTFCVSS